MPERDKLREMEAALLPHLDAAYNLARWICRDQYDAEDVVQEAYARAVSYYASYRGGDAKAWMLAIVRNAAYTFLRRSRSHESAEFDEELHSHEQETTPDPEQIMLRKADGAALREALLTLPGEFREVIVLRELEGLSYSQIAEVAGVPIGTVMSRLARARKRLQQQLAQRRPQ